MVSSKSGDGVSWCAVPAMLSVQSSAYCSLLRVNKPLANVCILQEAMWDQSSGKVMGWDRGAAWLAGLCAPHQTQLGCGRLKRAMHKAGASVMQVESTCMGKGAASWKAKERGALGSWWLQVVPVGPCLCPALALAELTGRPPVLGRGRKGASASHGGARAGI